MAILETKFLTRLRKAESLKQESRKMLVLSAFTGIGASFSVIVGILLKEITVNADTFYYGTILSSFVLLPVSILLGLSIWDKVRTKWSVSDELVYQLNFLETEFQRNIKLVKESGMSENEIKKSCKIQITKLNLTN